VSFDESWTHIFFLAFFVFFICRTGCPACLEYDRDQNRNNRFCSRAAVRRKDRASLARKALKFPAFAALHDSTEKVESEQDQSNSD
jgi:hypothetical protein